MKIVSRCKLTLFFAGLVALAVLGVWLGWPWVYWAEPVGGRVVDKETGRPIEGAVIVAQWIPWWKTPWGGWGPPLHVTEVVTDGQGNFYVPGWGPKWRPWLLRLANKDPQLIVFKSSYQCINPLLNEEFDSDTSVRVSDWNGRTIELKRADETADRRADALYSMLLDIRMSPQVYRIYGEILKEKEELDSRASPQVLGRFFDTVARREAAARNMK